METAAIRRMKELAQKLDKAAKAFSKYEFPQKWQETRRGIYC